MRLGRIGYLTRAAFIASFDVPAAATAGARGAREQWDGLPSVSLEYSQGRDAIKARVHQLMDSLKRVQDANKVLKVAK